jgi:thiol-disulfide isomerase/thioredoxin
MSCTFLPFMRIAIIVLALTLLGAGKPHHANDLQGSISEEQLYKAFPVFKENAATYRPDPEAVRAIAAISIPTSIIAFLGTWCFDSKTEIPALMKTLAAAHNHKLSLELHAVDRAMEDGGTIADRFGIESVPTVIIMQNGKEVGRVKGLARDSMEMEIQRMLAAEK